MSRIEVAAAAYREAVRESLGGDWPEPDPALAVPPPQVAAYYGEVPGELAWLHRFVRAGAWNAFPAGARLLPWPRTAAEAFQDLDLAWAAPFPWRSQIPVFHVEWAVLTLVVDGTHAGEIWRYDLFPGAPTGVRVASSLADLFEEWTRAVRCGQVTRRGSGWIDLDAPRHQQERILRDECGMDPYPYPAEVLEPETLRQRQSECGVDLGRADDASAHQALAAEIAAAAEHLDARLPPPPAFGSLPEAGAAWRQVVESSGGEWPEPESSPAAPPLAVLRYYEIDRVPEELVWLHSFIRAGAPDAMPENGYLLPWPATAGEAFFGLENAAATPFPWRAQIPVLFFDHLLLTLVLKGDHAGEVWRYEIGEDNAGAVRAAASLTEVFGTWVRVAERGGLERTEWGSMQLVRGRFAGHFLRDVLRIDPFGYPLSLGEADIARRQRECGVDPELLSDFGAWESTLREIMATAAQLDGS